MSRIVSPTAFTLTITIDEATNLVEYKLSREISFPVLILGICQSIMMIIKDLGQKKPAPTGGGPPDFMKGV